MLNGHYRQMYERFCSACSFNLDNARIRQSRTYATSAFQARNDNSRREITLRLLL